jgi:hypothetical protein
LLDWIATRSATRNSPNLYACVFRPFGNSFLHTIKLDNDFRSRHSLSSVACLFSACCPAAVGRLVISIVVNSVDCVPARPIAHVFKEITKRLSPPFADGNTSAAIVFVSNAILAIAPINHILPSLVFWHSRKAMDRGSLLGSLATKAAATARPVLVSQLVRCGDCSCSAFANAVPRHFVVFCTTSKRDDEKPVKPLASKIWSGLAVFRLSLRFGMIHGSHRLFLGNKGTFWSGSNGVTALLRPVSLYHNLLGKGGTCGKS